MYLRGQCEARQTGVGTTAAAAALAAAAVGPATPEQGQHAVVCKPTRRPRCAHPSGTPLRALVCQLKQYTLAAAASAAAAAAAHLRAQKVFSSSAVRPKAGCGASRSMPSSPSCAHSSSAQGGVGKLAQSGAKQRTDGAACGPRPAATIHASCMHSCLSNSNGKGLLSPSASLPPASCMSASTTISRPRSAD